MILVGLCSTYKEGPLAREAVRSLLEANTDQVLVLEGPAGEPIDADVPATDLGELAGDPRLTYREGRWRTDARKRQAMLDWSRQFEPPVWALIVDGDEALVNGRYARDWLQRLDWHSEVDPEAIYHGKPMRLVELDGTISWVMSRMLRLDLIAEYVVSSHVLKTTEGELWRQGGNRADSYDDWAAPRAKAIEEGRMLMMPPLPVEPYLVHRSLLRHPLRAPLRLHEQEKVELAKAGLAPP